MAITVNNVHIANSDENITEDSIDGEVNNNSPVSTFEQQREAKKEEIRKKIKKAKSELKNLKTQKSEYSDMVGNLNNALTQIENAAVEVQETRKLLTGSYNGNDARKYVNKVDDAEENIALNKNKIKMVSKKANEIIKDIEEKIEDKNKTIKKLQNQLYSL